MVPRPPSASSDSQRAVFKILGDVYHTHAAYSGPGGSAATDCANARREGTEFSHALTTNSPEKIIGRHSSPPIMQDPSMSSPTVSSPSSDGSSSPPTSVHRTPRTNGTNTLVLAQLPKQFFDPVVMVALREHFEAVAPIHSWAPLRAFGRVILVYHEEEAAEVAKLSCDGIVIDATSSTCVLVPLSSMNFY